MTTKDSIDIPNNANFVTVTAEWMKACGKGEEAKTFPIHRIRGRTPGGAVIIEVIEPDWRIWTVILPWRGKFS